MGIGKGREMEKWELADDGSAGKKVLDGRAGMRT